MDECTLNDLLECSVCLERLDTSSRVLPCQHTFCKKCLEEIVSTHRELRCPECRILVDAKIEELPPNVLLMRILEGMRNATPKIAKSCSKSNSGTQRLFGGHQIAPVPIALSTSSVNVPSGTTNAVVAITTGHVHTAVAPNESSRHHNPTIKQPSTQSQAYARALYDYVSKVPGDLSFKKGDVIILKKKIDNNWYLGENGNNHGVFPLSYVQVMTPLAAHVPQCKALYDFKMTNDEEDGCLTFSKGEVINVIRRVDENWAEGKLLDRIGIFPLAFVELNNVARALMKLSTNTQPGPSRVAPPTPTTDETTPLIPTDHSRTIQANNSSRGQVVQSTATPVSDSVSSGSSGSSSTTTTPNTPNSSSTSSSSSTAPSSPSSPAVSPPILGNRHNLKRHSFTAMNTGQQVRPQHRHSAEILSPTLIADSTTLDGGKANLSNNPASISLVTGTTPLEHGTRHRRSGSSDLVLAQSSQAITGNLSGTSGLPAAYVALYPYKPQKADELELRKGGIYMVTERCQDGWFKGTSNRTQKCGVFPGNYVALAKCQRGLCRGSNTGQIPNSPFSGGQSNASETPRMTSTANSYGKNKGTVAHAQAQAQSHNQYNPRTALPPPELPPRALSPAPVVSSPWHGQNQVQSHTHLHAHSHPTTQPQSREDGSVAQHNQLGRSHSTAAASNTVTSSPGKQLSSSATAVLTNSTVVSPVGVNTSLANASNTAIVVPSANAAATSSSNASDCNRSPSNTSRITNAVGTPSSPNTCAAASSKFPDKPKEKKDKCVSLMRRLTNMKKSKSPPPASYSMDNPVFEDGNTGNPIHIRSGSCPSQLLDAGLSQELSTSVTHHRSCPGSTQGASHVPPSQRVKYKERPSLPLSILQRSNDLTGMVCSTPLIGNHHRKSNSLDAGMGKQLKLQSTRERDRVYRFRCIVPYPPNSEFELELRVGDIIYVHKKRDDGWYKGTQQRTGRTGLFPASFVEAF